MPVSAVRIADSPRLAGEDSQHTRLLAGIDATLPPILVHRTSMRVVDGMHRLRAAMLNGREFIEVEYFDGTEADAFVLAVQANIAHGLPLALADRRAAAARIVASHPEWSDRAIASVTGLGARTVRGIRQRDGTGVEPAAGRIGRDGRVRPLDGAQGRRAAGAIVAARPDASLREIARAAGISPATARDVRARIQRGEDPVPAGRRTDSAGTDRPAPERPHAKGTEPARRDVQPLVEGLRSDPALRFTDSGRALLRWLLPQAVGVTGWNEIAETIPPHCTYLVADLARCCAGEWLEFAQTLERRLAP